MNGKVIGKVSATESSPSTTDEFCFWTKETEVLSPFDIVKVEQLSGKEGESTITYAVVEEINHITDSHSHFAAYISSDFGDTTKEKIGSMDRLGMNYIKAHIICNTGDIYMPVLNGKLVYLCDAEDIQIALGLKDVKNPIVSGYLQMYKGKDIQTVRVDLNSKFLIGPDGAHLNVSGISGLAAKTSYSMFLLNAIQQKLCIMDDADKTNSDKQDIAFVFFNVKGRDLLAIDQKNDELEGDELEKQMKLYEETLGLNFQPFRNVTYYYPDDNRADSGISSYAQKADYEKQAKEGKAFKFYTPYESNQDKLDLVLAQEDDSSHTMESCLSHIMEKQENFSNIASWETLKREIRNRATNGASFQHSEILTSSWKKFLRIINKNINEDTIFNDAPSENGDKQDLKDVIFNELKGGDIKVIDIARLDDNTQSFVFASVIRDIYDMKFLGQRENGIKIPDKVIIFVDELNKFASTDIPKDSPILKQLLDITERGRSQGIILFSIEQFRSAIVDRVEGNCATAAYGRTNATEISKPVYRFIPPTFKNKMTRLPQGEYILANPALSTLVNVKFPMNVYKQYKNG